jgi:hypothetical protein
MPLRINYPTQLITTVGQQVRIALPALNSRTLTSYVVTTSAEAIVGAESLAVTALTTRIYAGDRLKFGPSSILAVVAEDCAVGATAIPTLPLTAVIATGLTATTFATLFVAGATDASPSSQPKTTDATNFNSGAGSEMAVVGTSRTLSFTFNRIEGDVGGDALMQVLYNDAYYNREIFAFVERTNGEIYSGAAIATTGAQQGPVQEKVTMNVNLQFQGTSFQFTPSPNASTVFA